jgi:hypothetical protein
MNAFRSIISYNRAFLNTLLLEDAFIKYLTLFSCLLISGSLKLSARFRGQLFSDRA